MSARGSSARVYFHGLPASMWERLEGILERFEDKWREGERTELAEFLEGNGQEWQALLIELVHADLHYRLKAGEAVRLESHLSRFPELAADDAVLLESVWQELDLRRRQDPAVDISEVIVHSANDRQREKKQQAGCATHLAPRDRY